MGDDGGDGPDHDGLATRVVSGEWAVTALILALVALKVAAMVWWITAEMRDR